MQFYRRALAVLAALSIFGLAFAYSTTTYAAEFDCSTATDVSQAECEALMDLYNAADGDNWTDNTDWAVSTEVCTWFGVLCTVSEHVVQIQLIDNNLSGDISGIQFDVFPELRLFFLQDNTLTGALPASLPDDLLQFNVSGNEIGGTIPITWNGTNLPFLLFMLIYDNNITGTIPADLGTIDTLVWLDASDNLLNGNLPSSIGNLTELSTLNLSRNDLNGVLPTSLENLLEIVELNLSGNEFTGTLPANIADWEYLEVLNLGQNQFSGPFPDFSTTELLYWIDLYQASGTCGEDLSGGLNGTIGDWLNGANYPNMEIVNLEGNCFSGDIPNFAGNDELTFANFSRNPWTAGPIPAWISSSTTLQHITMDYAQRTGTIPTMASGVLQQFAVGGNSLTGNIPTSFNGTNHPNMTALSVYANNLGGALPTEIGTLTNMTYLALQGNNFTSLPASITNLTLLENFSGLWLNYNVLEPTEMSPEMIDFIDSVYSPSGGANPAWQNTQTLAPGNVQVTNTTTSSVTLSWTHRGDFTYNGRYEIGVSTTDGGPYTFDDVNDTANKNVSSLTITKIDAGTDLAAETTYYFVVRKVRDALPAFAPESVSGNSAQVSAVTTGEGGGDPTEKPSKPNLVSPTAGQTVIGDASPAFAWDENPGEEQVTTYRLFVRDTQNTVLVNEAFNAVDICSGGVCTGDVGELDTPINLKNGEYSFHVRATNVVGNNDSAYRAFSVAFPAKPTLVSPIDNIALNDAQPEFTWTEAEGAAEYRLTIYDADKKKVGGTVWLASAAVNCNGTNCSFDITPTSLKNGAYSWKVEARNTAVSPSKSQSVQGKFKVAFPGVPTLVSPIGNVAVNDNQPLFTWTEVEAAAEYRLTIYNAAKQKVGGTIWLTSAAVNCDGTNCSFDITPTSLKNGAHTWVVETRDTAASPSKMKSTKGAFKVVFPGVPTDLTPAPDTTLDIASPTFTWSPVENATKYRLTITRNVKPTPPALNQVFDAVDICTLDTCTVDLSALTTPVVLKKGAHKWQVKATAPGGYTSATTKQPFSIVLP